MVKTEPLQNSAPSSGLQSVNPSGLANANANGTNGNGSTPNGSNSASSTTGGGGAPPSAPSSTARSSAKDPSRPRRKKARRACFACQRAHLTCGDERPCQRCIKRGLQDACHDGVRKKAKYLHDAPIDDGPPEFAPQPPSSSSSSYPYHAQLSQPPTTVVPNDMLPPDGTINPNSIESPGGGLGEQQPQQQQSQQTYSAGPLFDPSDPALFNFDIASLNFGSHYGALEFGVLGQMSNNNNNTGTRTGAATPDNGNSVPGSTYGYSPGGVHDYVGFTAPQDVTEQQWATSRGSRDGAGGFANTYMIEAGPGSLTSPSPPVESPRQNYQPPTAPQASGPQYSTTDTPTTLGSPSFFTTPPQLHSRPIQPSGLQQVHAPTSQAPHQHSHPHPHPHPHLSHAPTQRRRRPDDPSHIYHTITQPYPYALQHHRLFHMLESRFPKPLLLRIARAMAAFRPSFIACTQTLKADDLLFMEKCFQRTLWEYERFIQSCGTPTIVCRRTGEVVGVGKEFCMLTGWERSVLLGEKRNQNVNRPFAQRPPGAQPLLPPPPGVLDDGDGDFSKGVRRPVFLAELLDDESVVEFYEQFARLAFGDSRGAVMTTCKVLTYKLPPDEDGKEPAGKAGGLAGKEGKVECAFCWTIKRDVFDIPMLIVGNVSAPVCRGGF
ncbi:hypothetical protein EDC01DRAFT_674249 [Geopyxis carbonaria]|nr:hypothetical protein EDC01DRAFT_674249 [Geopyxis carbonaria]